MVRLTVLVDNNTLCTLKGEWGLSYFIEDEDKKILFDTGYSDLFIKNAEKLDINIEDTDYIVFSHGHYDHTWGIQYLIRLYRENWSVKEKRPELLAHPYAFIPKINSKGRRNGTIISKDEASRNFKLNLSKEPVWITDRLVFLGEIERVNKFQEVKTGRKIIKDGKIEEDYLIDDTALAYKTEEGIVVITGCSHSGICNIVEYAKKVCKDDRIVDIIGGFHLLNPPKEKIEGTLKYMRVLKPRTIHPCHCTDLKSKIVLSQVANVEEVGVGLTLEYK
ncbi:MBL fold metallo-hydrolase [Caldisalinibacter kiritimatiensis]|uniref:Metal-dependent hydrolases of the beta-lactamase superfamily II n=1 Tax=Caldisalinibacter kiritimatiensis TaxID=1304284 RepID=R1ASV5_9FIRM|nr:MBL fold metallo-hydrolase [Caldisalinibacter kiritimatiensis]EOC99741.1 Metal-dependent hydrolases of the beta-lactamase superfamily II [Caldisalinibacter kiritimatiensis]